MFAPVCVCVLNVAATYDCSLLPLDLHLHRTHVCACVCAVYRIVCTWPSYAAPSAHCANARIARHSLRTHTHKNTHTHHTVSNLSILQQLLPHNVHTQELQDTHYVLSQNTHTHHTASSLSILQQLLPHIVHTQRRHVSQHPQAPLCTCDGNV